MTGRRKTDWIQFAILLTAIGSVIVGGLVEAGRMEERSQNQGEEMQELKQDVKDLNKKVDEQSQEFEHQMEALRERR